MCFSVTKASLTCLGSKKTGLWESCRTLKYRWCLTSAWNLTLTELAAFPKAFCKHSLSWSLGHSSAAHTEVCPPSWHPAPGWSSGTEVTQPWMWDHIAEVTQPCQQDSPWDTHPTSAPHSWSRGSCRWEGGSGFSPCWSRVEQILALDVGSRNSFQSLGLPSSAGCTTTCKLD